MLKFDEALKISIRILVMLGLERRWWVLIGVSISGIMVAIDFTIVNTVLPDIQRTFSANMNTLQWVMTGFGITFSSFLITMGRLGDLWGRRRMLYIGGIGFGLASLGAGFSFTIHHLIICRILQGIFGAIMFPCGLAITSSSFDTKEQGRALGIYGSLLGIGLAIGPVLGGVIASISSWRWIFFINIPTILLSFAICIAVVEESRSKAKITIDWLGMIITTTGLAAFVFAVTQSQVYGWHSPYILIPLVAALLLFTFFFIIEKNVASPLLPPYLFLNHSFFISVTVYSICVGLVWTIIFFVPLYLQTVFGLSDLKTGLLLLPMTAMTILAPPIAGYMFDQEGPFTSTMFAFSMSIFGIVLFLFFSTKTSFLLLIIAFVCVGLAWGLGNGIALPLALSNPENKEHEGLISGAAITVLNVFGVLILSIASTLFHYMQNRYAMVGEQQAFMVGFKIVNMLLLFVTVMGFFAVIYTFNQMKQDEMKL